MEALGAIAAAVGAALGQWLNRYKANNTAAIKLALCGVGLAAYALGNGLPTAWTGPPLAAWLNAAWPWALAVPGAASLTALVPNMATNTK